MARNFGEIAFTERVKEIQERLGSRKNYARMEQSTFIDGLTENQIQFISERDSFYLASIGESGFPSFNTEADQKDSIKFPIQSELILLILRQHAIHFCW
jgi:hypothetical protein